MERLVKLRSTSRGWLTRTCKVLDELSVKQDVTDVELKDALTEFDSRLAQLDDIQGQVESESEQSKLEDIIDEAFSYRQKQKGIRYRAELVLQKLSEKRAASTISNTMRDESSSHQDSSHFTGHARLPKLELPKFGGNHLEFSSFFDKFIAVVDGSALPAVTKFTYLQSLLTGEALASIKGLTVTDDSYPVAKEILQQRYGRKERIVFAHIQKLLALQVDCRKSNGLWNLFDSLQTHVRCLETLGVSGDTYGVILTPLILSRIPQEIRMEWAREGEGKESDLTFLLEFLFKEIKRRERSETFQTKADPKPVRDHASPMPSVASFHANSNGGKKQACSFCNKLNHRSKECYSLRQLKSDEIRERVQSLRLCFLCFGKHKVRDCYSKQMCKTCNQKHNSLICGNECNDARLGPSTTVKETNTKGVHYAHFKNPNKTTLMQVVRTSIRVANGEEVEADVLFDGGSDRSFLTRNVASRLDSKKLDEEIFAFSGFGSISAGPRTRRRVYSMKLGGVYVELAEIDTICADMYRAPVPQSILDKFNVPFTEDLGVGRSIKVDILIGLDYYWQLVRHEVIHIDSLVGQKTNCGWMLSGVYRGQSKNEGLQLLCAGKIPDTMIRNLWELDAIGVTDEASFMPDEVGIQFENTVSYEKGRYSVCLPWKSEQKGKLLNNKAIAEKRLKSLSRRLEGNPGLKESYNKNLAEMEQSGIIKEVSEDKGHEGPVFYLPHRPVVREDSRTTKVRPVFDASAKGWNGVSLNDCLETGPNLLPNLVEVLTRFRRWRIAVTADVAKAFLQIKVNEADQNVLRFLWETDGRVREMVFDRVPFGTNASPFLLNATIKHHLGKYEDSKATVELQNNLYVDDFLSGADTEEEALQLIACAKRIMSEAGMDLTKWSSNNKTVADTVLKEFDPRFTVIDSTKVLGLKWIPTEDCFSFNEFPVPEDLVITKRTVLSFTARLFDPLGFLTPFIITAKLLFQELWELGVEWDLELPDPWKGRFEKWLKELSCLQGWKVPRCFASSAWGDADSVQLHIFCDASEKAYGCCAYLRVEEGSSVTVSLVMSKARVAPLKSITLPRLELLGALLGARVLRFLLSALHLPPDTKYSCFTDSMVTLGWIKGVSHRWKTFVANRVQEIQNLSNPSCWNHVAGSENPADMLTRGLDAQTLTNSSFWLQGPSWVAADAHPVSDEVLSAENEEDFKSEMKVTQCVTTQTKDKETFFEIEKWSSLGKATHIMGWVLRFVACCYKQSVEKNQSLTFEEVKNSTRQLIRMTQLEYFDEDMACLKVGKPVPKSSCLNKLSPFIGEDGLLRARCRLNYSDLSYDEKFPIILPKCHLSLLLVRDTHVKLKHAGVNQMVSSLRNQYWIIGLRTLAKRVKRECLPCKRLDAKSCQEPVAPLMEARLKQTPPFSVVGIDYAGPIYCRDVSGQKFYVLLFTCAAIRAVHLELVESLALSHFLLAFQRFIARRGMPNTIFSDNAMTFKSASSELVKRYGPEAPYWRFSVPRAPWWGGWWERMIKVMKLSLKRSVGLKCLEKSRLETTLIEVEACINSRPLTFVGDDISSGNPLTPSHFLVGRGNHLHKVNVPSVVDSTIETITSEKQVMETQLAHFWDRWQTEYLKQLPLPKRKDKYGKLEVGSVVLIREDNIPRLQWPMGVIEDLIKGKDGVFRTVKVRTKAGCFTRPIQRIHDLELNAHPINEMTESGNDQVVTTRSGRQSKAPHRF